MRYKIKNKKYFWTGISILAILCIAFFIPITLEEGANYVTYDTLLGIMIFHNPFILGIYVLVAIILIVKSLKKKS